MSPEIHVPKRPSGEPFFVSMGLLLFCIVVAGFGASMFSKPGGVWSLPLLYHLHGFIFLSWFFLFTLQASFVRNQKLQRHQTVGKLSCVLAIGMLVTGYFMMRTAYNDADFRIGTNSHDASMMFPITDLVNFSIAFVLGLYHRANAITHKRLLLLAGILILDPAVARLVEAIGAPFMMIPVLELGILFALLGYDARCLRYPHWTSLLGVGLWLSAMGAKLVLAQLPGWKDVAASLFS